MKDDEQLVNNGLVLATWKTPKPRMVFDNELFAKVYPKTWLHYYVEKTGTRRFSIKKEKGD